MVVRGAVGTAAETEVVVRYLARHFPGPDVRPAPGAGAGTSPGRPVVTGKPTPPADGIGPAKAVEVSAGGRRGADTGWPMYGHDAGGQRYSPLTQITAGERRLPASRVDPDLGAAGPARYAGKRCIGRCRGRRQRGRPGAPGPHIAGHAAGDQRRDVSDHLRQPGRGPRARDRSRDLGVQHRGHGCPGAEGPRLLAR